MISKRNLTRKKICSQFKNKFIFRLLSYLGMQIFGIIFSQKKYKLLNMFTYNCQQLKPNYLGFKKNLDLMLILKMFICKKI